MKALIVVGDATDLESEETAAGIAALIKNYEKNSGQKVDSVEIKRYSDRIDGLTMTELPRLPMAYHEREHRPARSGKGERKRNKKDRWR